MDAVTTIETAAAATAPTRIITLAQLLNDISAVVEWLRGVSPLLFGPTFG